MIYIQYFNEIIEYKTNYELWQVLFFKTLWAEISCTLTDNLTFFVAWFVIITNNALVLKITF